MCVLGLQSIVIMCSKFIVIVYCICIVIAYSRVLVIVYSTFTRTVTVENFYKRLLGARSNFLLKFVPTARFFCNFVFTYGFWVRDC